MEDVLKQKSVSSLRDRLSERFGSIINEYEVLLESSSQHALERKRIKDECIVDSCVVASKKYDLPFIDVYRSLGDMKRRKSKRYPDPEILKSAIQQSRDLIENGESTHEAITECSEFYDVPFEDLFIGYFINYELSDVEMKNLDS